MIRASRPRPGPSAGQRRGLLIALLAGGIMLAVSGPAQAYWTASSSGPYALAQAATLATPGFTVGTVTPTTIPLSWTQPFTPTAYTLAQTPGTLSGCTGTPATGTTSCTATALTPNTAYSWTLSAKRYNWVSTATVSGTTSKQATTTTLSNITPTTGTAGSTFSVTATVTGNSGYGTPAGTAVFSLYSSATCSDPASYTSAARTLAGGSVTGSLQPAVAGTYYWRATYTPTDSYNSASTSACSAAITVTPAGGTFFGAGSPVTVTSSTKGLTIPYPAGTTSGDLVLLVLVNNATQSSKINDSGWTLIDNPGIGGSGMALNAWWHTAGTESSIASMEIKTDSGGTTVWVLTYKNMANPAVNRFNSGTSTSASSLTPANLTTTAANTTVISLVGVNASRTLSLATPQGFSARAALQNTGGDGRALGVADRYAASAGAITSPTWTESGTPATQWAYITVAFTS